MEEQIDNYSNDTEALSYCYHALILFFLKTGNLRKASAYSNMYNSLCKRNGQQFYADYYFLKYKIDSVNRNNVLAIKDYQRYEEIKDSVFEQIKKDQMNGLHILNETEKKDKFIETLKKETELQQRNLHQANLIQTITSIGLILLLIIASLLYYSYRVKRKTNKTLYTQQEEINKKNQSLQKLVNEKEWLVKEIHHRIKNNLHMVVGLLASQAEYLKGKEALDAINESQQRVQAMSLIHQKLYQTENLSTIDMPSYIHEMTEHLKISFDRTLPIRFILDIEKVAFPLSHSVPIGLILNEAITNSIKYAFPGGRSGEIKISLKQIRGDHFTLVMSDNGIGMPPAFNIQKNSSLGIVLIEGLSKDINGTLLITNKRGVTIELSFRLP